MLENYRFQARSASCQNLCLQCMCILLDARIWIRLYSWSTLDLNADMDFNIPTQKDNKLMNDGYVN